jgi:hypothetical protein
MLNSGQANEIVEDLICDPAGLVLGKVWVSWVRFRVTATSAKRSSWTKVLRCATSISTEVSTYGPKVIETNAVTLCEQVRAATSELLAAGRMQTHISIPIN